MEQNGEDKKTPNISKWNQQGKFDDDFHSLARKARDAQFNKDVITWQPALECLYVHIDAILDPEERIKIYTEICNARILVNKFEIIPQKFRAGELLGRIYSQLFNLDIKIRRSAHQHNSFIVQKEQEATEDDI